MPIKTLLLLLLLITGYSGLAQSNKSLSGIYSVMDFGTPHNQRVNAQAFIQRAIDSCAANGGGTVFFPAGDYYSATIRLRSNVELNFSLGATLHALPDASLYTNAKQGLENSGEALTPALILGTGLRHIAITGRGRIVGAPEFGTSIVTDNDTYPGWNETARRAGVPMDKPFVKDPKVSLVYLSECEDVILSDISIIDSPNWACHIQWSKRVRVTSIVITSSLQRGVNSDGLDIDGCQDVVVTGCVVTTGDDAICLKSTRQGGRSEPCTDILVNNCVLSSTSCALKIGTETHSDFRRIVFSNCVIKDTNRGLGIIVRDGATVSDVLFTNIIMDCQRKPFFWWGDGDAFQFVVLKRNPDSKVGRIERVSLRNITARVEGTSLIQGIGEGSVDNLVLADVSLVMNPEATADRRATHALVIERAKNVRIRNSDVTWRTGVTGLAKRHSLQLTSVTDLKIDDFTTLTDGPLQPLATIGLLNVQRAAIQLPVLEDLPMTYIRVEGPQTRNVMLQSTRKEKQPTRYVVAPTIKNQVTVN